MRLLGRVMLGLVVACAPGMAGAQTQVLIVSGLGGETTYSRQFAELSKSLATAAHARFGVPDSLVSWFGEDSVVADAHYRGVSTRANVERALATMAARALPGDRIVVALIGHGAGSDAESRLSLPGPDLTAADFKRLLDKFTTQPVAVLLLMSGAGDAVAALSAPNRVVISATKTSYERNEAHFPTLFVKGLAEDGADTDKDGRVSLYEAFRYATRETKRGYDDTQKLQTEHAVLDDNGDGQGSDAPNGRDEGALARRFFLDGGARLARAGNDAALNALYAEQFALEDEVEGLRLRKQTMTPAQYESELERVLVMLARKAREIRQREGAK
jgi:hypothetical protein